MDNNISSNGLKKSLNPKNIFKCIIIIFPLTIMLIVVNSYRNVIFQRGNPIPYLIASMYISDETPFIEVGDNTGIFISKIGECPALFKCIEKSEDVKFEEQYGSGYVFTNGIKSVTISSEIYWGRFTVWDCPQLECNQNDCKY